MNYEKVKELNQRITKTNIKGKPYVMVKDRIAAFRELMPGGRIETDIVEKNPDEVTIRARVYDEGGVLLGTGHANEIRTSSNINKTSYIENCETSAIGRAIALACGIGIEDSFASAEEVRQAQEMQAGFDMLISDEDADRLAELLGDRLPKALAYYGVADVHLLTNGQFSEIVRRSARK